MELSGGKVAVVTDAASGIGQALAVVERFGAVHVVGNNAGVAGRSGPWNGLISSWEWVLGVNF